MEKIDYEPKVTLWILKIQNSFSNFFKYRLIASLFIFYLPIVLIGLILQFYYNYSVFSQGIFFALTWLGIAPCLIESAFLHIKNFFESHKALFLDIYEWKDLYKREISRIQSRDFLFFGIPWGIITSIVLYFLKYHYAPLLIKIWGISSFFLLFLISAIGFWGMYLLVTMMKEICSAKINFNPYHPDRFGGISDFGRFAVKGALFFSSGAMVFPLVFEIANEFHSAQSTLLLIVYILAGIFIMVMIASFILPILEIKKLADKEKEKVILKSRTELDNMIDEFNKEEGLDLKKAIEITLHYHLRYSKLSEIKDYPWDFRVLLEFSMSFIIPILVTIIQIVLQ